MVCFWILNEFFAVVSFNSLRFSNYCILKQKRMWYFVSNFQQKCETILFHFLFLQSCVLEVPLTFLFLFWRGGDQHTLTPLWIFVFCNFFLTQFFRLILFLKLSFFLSSLEVLLKLFLELIFCFSEKKKLNKITQQLSLTKR